jgi:hypothetical protein
MKIFKYIIIIIAFFSFFGCDKDTEGISRITEYATFDMKGEAFMFVLKNSTFTDPGIAAYQGETELSVATKGTVDTSVPGVYTIQYSATNSDGFPASTQRDVAVVAAMPTKDLSGTYQVVHATRTTKTTVSKNNGILGYYHSTDSWWQAYQVPLDFVDIGNGTIVILKGSSPYGGHFGTGAILADNQLRFDVTMTDQGPLNYSTTWKKQ